MSQQVIGIGAAPNDGTGDQLRTAFDKVNDNFTEVYTELGGTSLSNISFSANTISTDNTNGSLTIDPNGTGAIILDNAVTANSTVTITGVLKVASAAAFSGPSNTAVAFTANGAVAVSTGNLFTSFTTGGTITDFTGGVAGQIINIISKAATVYDVTGTNLKGGSTNITTASGDMTTWICENGTSWYLVGNMNSSINFNTYA
jgi:hypothetical protein